MTTETAAAALARLYDLDMSADPGDIDLWLALASRANGPILELASGTGRIAVPLAEAGHRIVGVDIDPAMIARAGSTLHAALGGSEARRNAAFVEGDARSVRLPEAGTFGLAFIGLNSLLQIGGRQDQLATMRTLVAHLRPGGIAAVDIWLPDAEDLARFDGRITLEHGRVDPASGHLVTKAASAIHDHASGTVRLSVIYEEGVQGHASVRWFREDVLRLISPDELRWLAEEAALEVELLAGGYALEPIGPGCDRAILVARRPG